MSNSQSPVKLWNALLKSIPGPKDFQLASVADKVPALRRRALKRLFEVASGNDRLLQIASWSTTSEDLKLKLCRHVLANDPSEKDLFVIMFITQTLRPKAWKALLAMEPSASVLCDVLASFSEYTEEAAWALLKHAPLSVEQLCSALRYESKATPQAAKRVLRRNSSRYMPELEAALFLIIKNACLAGFAQRAARKLLHLFPSTKNHLFVFNHVEPMRAEVAKQLLESEDSSLETLLELLRYPCGMRREIYSRILKRGVTSEELRSQLLLDRLLPAEREALCVFIRHSTKQVLQQLLPPH